jgi:hypothetical membrane protein
MDSDSVLKVMTLSRGAGVAWLSAGLSYLTLEGVAAAAFQPSYSYTRNFISDLGIPGHSAVAWLMNTAFVVQGALFLAGAVLIRGSRRLLAFAAANAAGNVLIALFHSGSATHAVGAVLAIVGGNAAILAGSSINGGQHRKVSLALGAFGLLSFVLFVVALKDATPPAVWERCSVYSITAWELVTGAWLLSRRPIP